MFYGYAESESLQNPLMLNDYKPVKVVIEYVPTSENHPYVHAYYFRFSDSEIEKEVERFAAETCRSGISFSGAIPSCMRFLKINILN